MNLSRRSFIGGTVASIGLLFGSFGWREEEVRASAQSSSGLTIEKLIEAKRVLDEAGDGPPGGRYITFIHPDRIEEAETLLGDSVEWRAYEKIPPHLDGFFLSTPHASEIADSLGGERVG